VDEDDDDRGRENFRGYKKILEDRKSKREMKNIFFAGSTYRLHKHFLFVWFNELHHAGFFFFSPNLFGGLKLHGDPCFFFLKLP
jgi:hypothetical protein